MTADNQNSLDEARSVALNAMNMLGKLGLVVQFLEDTVGCDNYDAIADHLFVATRGFGLSVTVQIRDSKADHCYADAGEVSDIDEKILTHLHLVPDRIVNFENCSVINFEYISLLIKKMPDSADEEQCVDIRDQMVRLLMGAEERIKFLVSQERSKMQHDLAVEKTLSYTQELLDRVNSKFHSHREDTSDIVNEFVHGLEGKLYGLGLDDDQERFFTEIVEQTSGRLFNLHQDGLEIGDEYRHLITQIRELL